MGRGMAILGPVMAAAFGVFTSKIPELAFQACTLTNNVTQCTVLSSPSS